MNIPDHRADFRRIINANPAMSLAIYRQLKAEFDGLGFQPQITTLAYRICGVHNGWYPDPATGCCLAFPKLKTVPDPMKQHRKWINKYPAMALAIYRQLKSQDEFGFGVTVEAVANQVRQCYRTAQGMTS